MERNAFRDSTASLVSIASSKRLLHRRVTGVLFALGLILTIVGFGADVLIEEGVFGDRRFASACMIAWAPGFMATLLSVLPTHTRSVRAACAFSLCFAIAGWYNAFAQVISIESDSQLRTQTPEPAHFRELIYWYLSLIHI